MPQKQTDSFQNWSRSPVSVSLYNTILWQRDSSSCVRFELNASIKPGKEMRESVIWQNLYSSHSVWTSKISAWDSVLYFVQFFPACTLSNKSNDIIKSNNSKQKEQQICKGMTYFQHWRVVFTCSPGAVFHDWYDGDSEPARNVQRQNVRHGFHRGH